MFAPLVAAALLAQSIGVAAGVSTATERTRFRFENASKFDTAELVPHFFAQKYEVPPLRVFVEAHYGTAPRRSSTRVSFTPRRNTRGSDIDTFLQPSGDIVTSGTDGPITFGGFSIDQRLALGQFRGWPLDATLGYRRDRSEFLYDDRVVTHTKPESVTRAFITDRETTIAQVMPFGVAARRERVHDNWRSRVDIGVQPVVAGRLLVRLPDKYPGNDLIFSGLSFGSGGSWTLERTGRLRVGVTFSASGAWGYRQSAAYTARSLGISVFWRAGPR